jgi:hypothetical protein
MHLPTLILALALSAPPSPSPLPSPLPSRHSMDPVKPFPLTWPIPSGWRSETILFPLDFARSIPYRGAEEIRFAPGFRDPAATDFFTYAFMWVIEEPDLPAVETLRKQLVTYFDGLMSFVAAERKKSVKVASKATLAPLAGAAVPASAGLTLAPVASGRIETTDAFFTEKPLALGCRIRILRPGLPHRQALYFEMSPRLDDPVVDRMLSGVRQALSNQ